MVATQTSHFQSNAIYPDMVQVLISIEGDLLACVDRVGVWSSSTTSSITSEVGLPHAHDLNENSLRLARQHERSGAKKTYGTTIPGIVCSTNNIPGRRIIDRLEGI